MLVTANEICASSEKIDVMELREQNCAPTGEISGATRVTSATTLTTQDSIVAIAVRTCATSIAIGVEPVTISSAAT